MSEILGIIFTLWAIGSICVFVVRWRRESRAIDAIRAEQIAETKSQEAALLAYWQQQLRESDGKLKPLGPQGGSGSTWRDDER